MAEIENTLSWSASRAKTFTTCKRKYYLQYYAKWGGWSADSLPEQQLAYRLSKMTALPMLVGSAVHDTIKLMLSRLAWGQPPLENPGHYARRILLAKAWDDAEHERWRESPKHHPPVFEIYYGEIPSRERLKAFGAQASRALHTFGQSTIYRALLNDDPARWLTLDRGPRGGDVIRPMVDDTPVWAIPDFARRLPDGRCEIWDWKTGRPRDGDELQLLAYGLFAHQVWGYASSDIDLYACYLDPEKAPRPVIPFTFNDAQLSRVTRVIRDDVAGMLALLADPEHHVPEALSAFPMTDREVFCRNCGFKEICGR